MAQESVSHYLYQDVRTIAPDAFKMVIVKKCVGKLQQSVLWDCPSDILCTKSRKQEDISHGEAAVTDRNDRAIARCVS